MLEMTDEAEMRRIVQESVLETLKVLGFNVENPEELRADMGFIRRTRLNVQAAGRGVFMGLGAAALTALGYGVHLWVLK